MMAFWWSHEDHDRPQPRQRRCVHVLRPRPRGRAHRGPRGHPPADRHRDVEPARPRRPPRGHRDLVSRLPLRGRQVRAACPAVGASGTGTARCWWPARPSIPGQVAEKTVAVPGTMTVGLPGAQALRPEGDDPGGALRPDPRRGGRGPCRRGPDHPRGPADLRRSGAAQDPRPGGLVEGGDRAAAAPWGQRGAPGPRPGADGAADAPGAARRCVTHWTTGRRPSSTR